MRIMEASHMEPFWPVTLPSVIPGCKGKVNEVGGNGGLKNIKA